MTQPRPDSAVGRIDGLLSRVPFYAVLLSAYPVLRLYSDNIVEVDGAEVLPPLVLVVAIATVGLVILAKVWGDARRAALLVTALVVPALTFGLITAAVEPFSYYELMADAHVIALLTWLIIVCVAFYAAMKLRDHLAVATQALNVVAVTLVVLTLVPISSFLIDSRASDGRVSSAQAFTGPTALAGAAESEAGRDIYHFVLDRYGSDNALRVGRDIDNHEFTDWLREQGFDVPAQAHANYERTALSLSATHNMALHGDLAVHMGPNNWSLEPLFDAIGNSPAAAILQGIGYEYYHVGSWNYPTAWSAIADHVDEPAFSETFATTLVEQSVISGLSVIASSAHSLSGQGKAEATIRQLERISEISREPGPKYVYAHLLVPHEPYLFLADGTLDPGAATFRSQLEFANNQMREIVEPLLALPDEEQPIIIIQADEGPYPRSYPGGKNDFDWSAATDEELVTKFGVLNAMYLPGPEGAQPLPHDISLVNTFPEIFGRYFGLEVPRVPDRTFAMGHEGPYDMYDVTEALQAAAGRVSAEVGS